MQALLLQFPLQGSPDGKTLTLSVRSVGDKVCAYAGHTPQACTMQALCLTNSAQR